MKKTIYEQPTTRILVVRVEDCLLTISAQGNTIAGATIDEWEDEL